MLTFVSFPAKDSVVEVMAPLVEEASKIYKDLPTDPQEFIEVSLSRSTNSSLIY